jgi:NAD(P)-dependent dehydrogenase (short-subunit alcohol dehydrogenase family)
MSVEECVAVVTGGSGGIGEATARRLAKDGYRVAVVASSRVEKAERVVQVIRESGGSATAFACDLRDPSACAALAGAIVERLGRIDTLVNSAGVFIPTPAGSAGQDDVQQTIDINLLGTWNMIDKVVPVMKAAGAGKIVNVASIAGLFGLSNYAIYCATKAGIVMMTRALACELGRANINVNCVAPGNTATAMNEDIRNDPSNAAFRDLMAARTPSTRVFSEPEDIAGAISFLASGAARAMHGSCLLMDEGITAGI